MEVKARGVNSCPSRMSEVQAGCEAIGRGEDWGEVAGDGLSWAQGPLDSANVAVWEFWPSTCRSVDFFQEKLEIQIFI